MHSWHMNFRIESIDTLAALPPLIPRKPLSYSGHRYQYIGNMMNFCYCTTQQRAFCPASEGTIFILKDLYIAFLDEFIKRFLLEYCVLTPLPTIRIKLRIY